MGQIEIMVVLALIATIWTACKDDEPDDPEPEVVTVTAEDFSTSLDENTANGASLGFLEAEASDGSSVSFSLKSQSVNGAIALSSSGALSVADSSIFDFELNREITAEYLAVSGLAKDSASITITISDVDDNPEISAQTFTATIDENPNNGQVLGVLEASISNGKDLTYSLTDNALGALALSIDIDAGTASLVVNDSAAFDFEVNPSITGVFQVTDGELTATADITININDLDDVASITANDFTATIDENPTNGDVIGTMDATHSEGSSLTYSLTDNASGAVAINGNSGELTVADASAFDYETNQSLTAVYEVTDGTITEMATITITINDVDEAEITANDFTGTIDENPTNGDVIGIVNTSHSEGGSLAYSLVSQSVAAALNIDVNTGQLTVADASAFDYETNTSITAVYEASDPVSGAAPKTANITITINDVAESSWETIGTAGFTAQARHVELVMNGTPVLAYHDYSNVKAMTYNGASWNAVGGNISGNTAGIHLVANDGDIYIAYPDPDLGSTNHKATVKKYDGSAWTAVGPAGFSSLTASNLRLAFSGGGVPTVIYDEPGVSDPKVQNYDSYYDLWNSPFGGTSNGIESSLTEYTSGTDITLNPDENRWYVAYSVNSQSNRVRVKYWANINNNGAKWHSFGNLSGGSIYQNIIEFDANGTAYVLYKHSDDKLYMESRGSGTSGTSWSVLGGGALSDTMREYDFIMAGNTPYVVYEDGTDYKLTLKKWDGANWVTVSEDFATGTYPDLAYDSTNDEIYVAFADGNHSQQVTVMKYVPAGN